MKSLLPSALTVAVSLAALAAPPAEATVILKVGSATITDNGVGDLDPAVGQITSISAPPGFSSSIDVGTSTAIPSLDLSSVDISSTTPTTVVVYLTETNLTKPVPTTTWLTQFSGNWAGGAASVRLQTYFDPSNTAFGTTNLLADLNATSSPFALSSALLANVTTPYAITEVLTITAHGAREHFSLDATLSDAPEPASIALVGVGITSLAWLRRRKSES